MAWRFEPGERLSDAFRRVAAEEIAKVRRGLADPAKDRARAIHEARQGFKRLRALLRLAEPSLGKAFAEENRFWRDAGRQLSGSRDQTVLMESFDKIVAGCRSDLPAEDLDLVRAHLCAGGAGPKPSDAEKHVRIVLAQLSDAEARTMGLEWPSDAKTLAKGLRRSQARLKSNWKAARREGEPITLHDWRKRVKDQSAQLRLFRRVAPPTLRSRHADEKKTAELLGEEHDFWLLGERLRDDAVLTEATATCRVLIAEVSSRRKALRGEAFKLGKSFATQKPTAFAREMTAAWEKAGKKPARVRRKEGEQRATSPAS